MQQATGTGLIKAASAWREFGERLPWATKVSFYNALASADLPSVRFGSAVFVPRWVMVALVSGDVEALHRGQPVGVGGGGQEEGTDVYSAGA